MWRSHQQLELDFNEMKVGVKTHLQGLFVGFAQTKGANLLLRRRENITVLNMYA